MTTEPIWKYNRQSPTIPDRLTSRSAGFRVGKQLVVQHASRPVLPVSMRLEHIRKLHPTSQKRKFPNEFPEAAHLYKPPTGARYMSTRAYTFGEVISEFKGVLAC